MWGLSTPEEEIGNIKAWQDALSSSNSVMEVRKESDELNLRWKKSDKEFVKLHDNYPEAETIDNNDSVHTESY